MGLVIAVLPVASAVRAGSWAAFGQSAAAGEAIATQAARTPSESFPLAMQVCTLRPTPGWIPAGHPSRDATETIWLAGTFRYFDGAAAAATVSAGSVPSVTALSGPSGSFSGGNGL